MHPRQVLPRAAHFLVLAAMAGALAAAAPPAPRTAVDPFAQGRRLVELNCSHCHAIGAQGRSPDPVAPPFRDLNKRYADDRLDDAIEMGILKGHPMMPEFNFTPDQTKAIIRYLRSVQDKQAA